MENICVMSNDIGIMLEWMCIYFNEWVNVSFVINENIIRASYRIHYELWRSSGAAALYFVLFDMLFQFEARPIF